MAKIPVGATIAQSYRFAFQNFFRILGVMWLGIVIMLIPSLLFQSRMMALATSGPASVGHMLPFIIPFDLAVLVVLCMQMTGLAKLVLGVPHGPGWIYFSLGKAVWRLIGSILLLMVAMFVGSLIAVLASVLFGLLLGMVAGAIHFQPLTATIKFVIAIGLIAIWCGFFYSLVRLTFLLLPVIADERDGFALGHAWTLGKGNFWRMFAVLLLILLPFLFLEGALIFAMFRGLPFPSQPATAEQTAAFQAAMNARMIPMMNGIFHYWYLFYPLAVIVTVILYGMAVAAQCLAYRALTADLVPVAGDGLPDR